MKQLKPLSISVYILLFFLICFVSPFKINAQSSKEVTIDAISLNNEQVIFDNKKCRLDLKYNDVIKLVGRAPINTSVSISFANDEYKSVSDEMGNWMILFSIPYIEDGKYEIVQEGSEDSYCEINLDNTNKTEGEEERDNKSVYIITLLLVLSLFISSYVYLSKKKKYKK